MIAMDVTVVTRVRGGSGGLITVTPTPDPTSVQPGHDSGQLPVPGTGHGADLEEHYVGNASKALSVQNRG